MLFLDGVYIDSANRSRARFRWVKAPTSDELTQLTHTIAQRVGRYLERQGAGSMGSDQHIILFYLMISIIEYLDSTPKRNG